MLIIIVELGLDVKVIDSGEAGESDEIDISKNSR